MDAPSRVITPEVMAEGRRRYEQTSEPVESIAAFMKIGRRTLYAHIPEWGWRMRRARIPRTSPPAARRAVFAKPLIIDDAPAVLRIERMVERELAAVEQIVARIEPDGALTYEAERATRVLANLARTLHEVRKLKDTEAGGKRDDNRAPVDRDAFFLELARRIDAFAEAAAHSVPDAGDDAAGA